MLICYRDYIQLGTMVEDDDNPFSAENPITNMQDRRLAVPAIRDSSFPFVFFTVNWTEDVPIRVIALMAHNMGPELMSQGFSIVGRDASSNVVFGIQVFTGQSFWFPPADSLFPRNLFFDLGVEYPNVRSLTFDFFDSIIDGAPWQCGRFWAGPALSPEGKTALREFRMHARDDSVVNRSLGNQVYADAKQRYRQLTCSIPYMTEAEAIGVLDGSTPNLQDIAFEVGRAGEVIVIPSTEGGNQVIHKMSIYGHFLEPPSINLMDANKGKGRLYTSTFDVLESL